VYVTSRNQAYSDILCSLRLVQFAKLSIETTYPMNVLVEFQAQASSTLSDESNDKIIAGSQQNSRPQSYSQAASPHIHEGH
jgi:hypothetical protein